LLATQKQLDKLLPPSWVVVVLPFHHLLHPGMRNLDDGTDGWKGRPSEDKTKSII
jgi:hypothetical protein